MGHAGHTLVGVFRGIEHSPFWATLVAIIIGAASSIAGGWFQSSVVLREAKRQRFRDVYVPMDRLARAAAAGVVRGIDNSDAPPAVALQRQPQLVHWSAELAGQARAVEDQGRWLAFELDPFAQRVRDAFYELVVSATLYDNTMQAMLDPETGYSREDWESNLRSVVESGYALSRAIETHWRILDRPARGRLRYWFRRLRRRLA